MNKYENGKIYTIRCKNDDSLIYVGSTIQPLHQRWSGHKRYKKNPNMLLYQTINGSFDDWYIELFEPFSCNSKEKLNKREGEVIREIATLNMNIAGRTQQEWFKENKEHIKEYKKEWYKRNTDTIKEKEKEYTKQNKERKKQYDKQYRLKKKQEKQQNTE